ncbi:P-loop containing nucleoside triphosphate hydrolase protein [Meredithblackwellia eburnea MCA 4105]
MKHALSDDDEQLSSEFYNDISPSKRRKHSSPLPASSPPALSDDEDYADGGDLKPRASTSRDSTEQTATQQEEDQDNDADMDDMDEDPDEEKRTREGMEQIRQRVRGHGTIAQSGVILEVSLQNFMCHKLVTVKFGEQINFLTGHNGSGKSAVLTGISMALGGNAKTTNRAQKGGDLVRHGAQYAVCAVKIKNEGIDAFHPDVYGKTITVSRRINKDMGGGYQIKDHAGKTKDTKKAVLDAILDHFNIQVDNPMTVLTQDQSRQFLANSTPKDKYIFFLRGTQLAQLTEEYEKLRNNTEVIEEIYHKKKDGVEDLKAAYKVAKARAKEAELAIKQGEAVDKLKDELAWSWVAETEEKVNATKANIKIEEGRLEKAVEIIRVHSEEATKAENEAAELQEAIRAATDPAREEELITLRGQIKTLRDELKKLNNESREISSTKKNVQAHKAEHERSLEAEKDRRNNTTDAARVKVLDEIKELEDERNKTVFAGQKARHESALCTEKYSALKEKLSRVREEIEGAEAESRKSKERLARLQQSRSNSLLSFGNDMPRLVDLINRERGWNQKPIGPLGTLVDLKDRKYAKMLESFFNHTLNAFIVTNEKDKQILTRLQKQAGTRIPIMKQAEDRSFDCSAGEPAPDVLTIRRVLTFKHPAVDKALVDGNRIESAALVDQRALGDQLMRNKPSNVSACYSADGFKLGGDAHTSSTTAMDPWRGTARLNPDVASQISVVQAEIDKIQQYINNLFEQRESIDQQMAAVHREKRAHEDQGRKSSKRVTEIGTEIDALNDKLQEEEPTNLIALEELIKEQESELQNIETQHQALAMQVNDRYEKIQPLVAQKEDLERKEKENDAFVKKFHKFLEEAQKKVTTSHDHVKKFENQRETQIQKIEALNEVLAEAEALVEVRTGQATQLCEVRPIVEKRKTPEKLQQEIANVEKALKAREKKQGATAEQIFAKLALSKKTAEDGILVVKELKEMVRALRAAYDERIMKWQDFRTAIANRAKMQFLYHLSNRGFTGKLTFDHDKQKLLLKVQTDELEKGATQSRQKDAKSLSGGEKSFSTICLLLTMWEAVGCPIRCLDEFDVFMDSVNRLISMKMMTETAKAADSTQFILITPQSVSSAGFKWGPEVKVTKMLDPERGAGSLGTGVN